MKRVRQWFRKCKKRLKENGLKVTLRYYFSVLFKAITPEKLVVKLVKAFPIGKVLVFECENDMQDNARAFYEYLYKENYYKKYKMVWVVKDLPYCRKQYAKKNVRFVSKFSNDKFERIKFSYYMSRARYFFFTHPWWLKEWKKKQTVVHFDHGAFPLKGKDGTNKGGLGETFDYVLASSAYVVPWKCNFWDCTEEKAIVLGAPRNDWLFHEKQKDILKTFMEIEENEKILLAMPTFRQTKQWSDSEEVDKFCLSVVNSSEQLMELNALLQTRKMHILVKIHPLQDLDVIEKTECSNIHYLSNQNLYEKDVSVNELMACCDALITDFSSVYADFLLLNRPIGFFVSKEGVYKRGYIMDHPEDYMPGEKISDFDMLKQFVVDVATGVDRYSDERKRVNDLVNTYQDNRNCERIAKYFDL